MGNRSCGSGGDCSHLLSLPPRFLPGAKQQKSLTWLALTKNLHMKRGRVSHPNLQLLHFLFCFIFYWNILSWAFRVAWWGGNDAFSPAPLFLSYHQYLNMARCSLTSLWRPLGTSETIECSAPWTAEHLTRHPPPPPPPPLSAHQKQMFISLSGKLKYFKNIFPKSSV